MLSRLARHMTTTFTETLTPRRLYHHTNTMVKSLEVPWEVELIVGEVAETMKLGTLTEALLERAGDLGESC